MNELATLQASCVSDASRFPAHPIAGLAGTSLKHEHLPSILANDTQGGFFEVYAENYMGADGPLLHGWKNFVQAVQASNHEIVSPQRCNGGSARIELTFARSRNGRCATQREK